MNQLLQQDSVRQSPTAPEEIPSPNDLRKSGCARQNRFNGSYAEFHLDSKQKTP